MNRLVCFDSMVFNFAFRDSLENEKNPENIVKIQQVRRLVGALGKAGYLIVIPSIVLAEAACIQDELGRNRFFSSLPEGLIIGDFSVVTAQILAKILHNRNIETDKTHRSEHAITNTKMKYDSLILAIAVENECDCLYTMDSDFYKYDTEYIAIRGIEETPPSYPLGDLFMAQ